MIRNTRHAPPPSSSDCLASKRRSSFGEPQANARTAAATNARWFFVAGLVVLTCGRLYRRAGHPLLATPPRTPCAPRPPAAVFCLALERLPHAEERPRVQRGCAPDPRGTPSRRRRRGPRAAAPPRGSRALAGANPAARRNSTCLPPPRRASTPQWLAGDRPGRWRFAPRDPCARRRGYRVRHSRRWLTVSLGTRAAVCSNASAALAASAAWPSPACAAPRANWSSASCRSRPAGAAGKASTSFQRSKRSSTNASCSAKGCSIVISPAIGATQLRGFLPGFARLREVAGHHRRGGSKLEVVRVVHQRVDPRDFVREDVLLVDGGGLLRWPPRRPHNFRCACKRAPACEPDARPRERASPNSLAPKPRARSGVFRGFGRVDVVVIRPGVRRGLRFMTASSVATMSSGPGRGRAVDAPELPRARVHHRLRVERRDVVVLRESFVHRVPSPPSTLARAPAARRRRRRRRSASPSAVDQRAARLRCRWRRAPARARDAVAPASARSGVRRVVDSWCRARATSPSAASAPLGSRAAARSNDRNASS